jgi:hypothetical protein
MNAIPETPHERTTFDAALGSLLAQHATLRAVATLTSREGFTTDAVLSLADAIKVHETNESVLFETPFLTRTPKLVRTTPERLQRFCAEYTTGSHGFLSGTVAAERFVDALLSHLVAEEAWLKREDEHRKEHMLTIA